MKTQESNQNPAFNTRQEFYVDFASLSPGVVYRLRRHGERSLTTALNAEFDIQCAASVANKAIMSHANVSAMAAQAAQLFPGEEAQFRMIAEHNFRTICLIMNGGNMEEEY